MCRKVVQRKQKLIEVLRGELKDQIKSTFSLVVHLVRDYYKQDVENDGSITQSFLSLLSASLDYNSSEDESWL